MQSAVASSQIITAQGRGGDWSWASFMKRKTDGEDRSFVLGRMMAVARAKSLVLRCGSVFWA
eukprot:scaffold640_cov166-Amphora_coffeaeformis.AAC.9